MKGKSTKYIMIAGVALIWGLIIYKLVSNSAVPEVDTNLYQYDNLSFVTPQKDTFEVNTDQLNDPFRMNSTGSYVNKPINNNQSPKVTIPNTQYQNKRQTNKVSDRFTYPQLTYIGFIKNKSKGSQKGLLVVNQNLHRVENGEELQELTVKRLFRDSVWVTYTNDEQKTIYLKK